MGIRFDVVISGYILLFPAFVMFTLDILRVKSNVVTKFFFYWIFILFTIAFAIAAADIPYFNQFYDRFSVGAFEWFDNLDFVFMMIIQEPRYFLIIIPFIVFDVLFFIYLKRIFKKAQGMKKVNIFLNITISLLFLGVMFLGIRGRIEKKSPIRIGTAYFCENPFLNKLGLNPVFTLMRSWLDTMDSKNDVINLIDKNTSIKNVQLYLGIDSVCYNSPIARKVVPDTVQQRKPNVVIVIMESMSAAKIKRYGNTDNLTPFLDSLSYNSKCFDNIYTAGKHTFNGVFSTLFSFPALYRQHPMENIREFGGISSALLQNGYSTTYFTTHDSQFDNVEGFLRANGFQNIVSQKDYPLSEVKTTLGVPDDYLFRHSIPIINKLSEKDKPFFVTFMTASDHGPFYIPEYFHPKSDEIRKQIVEYADWSLRKFLTLASKEAWFDNTIFVFVADHGAAINASYDIALNYFHSPLIIYSHNENFATEAYEKIGNQIDIFPTVMGLINQPYVNNTLGIDLLKQDRKYAIFNDDDKIGIIDSTWFCIMKDKGNKLELYKYKDKNQTDYFEQEKDRARNMAEYAKSNMQVYQNMILNGDITLRDL